MRVNTQPHDDNNQKATRSVEPIDKVMLFPVEAAIWRNLSKDGDAFYSVTFERKYRNQEAKWKSSNSYNVEDLLLLAKVADLVHSKVVELRANDRQMKPPIRTTRASRFTASSISLATSTSTRF